MAKKDNHLKTEVERATTHLARKNPAAAHFCFWLEKELSLFCFPNSVVTVQPMSSFEAAVEIRPIMVRSLILIEKMYQ